MIKFKSVTSKNFLTVGDIPITIQLDRSQSTSIVGKNGSGKSSLISETISFALFGKSFRGLNKGELINTTNKKGTIVILEFDVNSTPYKVTRGIKPDTFTIEKNGVLIPEVSVVEYQNMLEKLIGFDHSMFCKTIVLGYANFTPFMSMTKAQRRQFVEDALGLSIFADMNKVVKAESTAHNLVINDLNTKISNTESYIDAIKTANIAAQNSIADEIKELQTNIGSIVESVTVKKSAVKELEQKAAEIFDQDTDGKQLTECQNNLNDIDATLRDLKREYADANTMLQFYNNNDTCPTCKTVMDADHKASHVNDLNENIAAIKIKAKSSTEYKAQVTECQSTLQAKLQEVNKISTKVSSINSEISDLINRAKFYKNEITRKQNSQKTIVDTSDAENKLQSLSSALAGALVKQEEYKIALELLKDSGIKAGVIEKYIPVLNKKINDLLDVIGFGVQLRFDENFQETLVGRYADEFSYNSLSQGERERMNLAIMFAWNYLMGMSSGVDSNLLVLDEIGMSALDADGVQSLFQLIDNEYDDGNVFVISHNPEVRHLCRSVISLVKKDGFVKIVD